MKGNYLFTRHYNMPENCENQSDNVMIVTGCLFTVTPGVIMSPVLANACQWLLIVAYYCRTCMESNVLSISYDINNQPDHNFSPATYSSR